MTAIYLSLGSNMGEREENIARAIGALTAHGARLVRQSSLYETEPVDMRSAADGWFLNCAAEVETELTPQELMRALLGIERSLGRHRPQVPGGQKESRTIDMDILLFGATILRSPELEIPHPRMAERRFVLVPLAEIAPGAQHPVLKRTIAELLAATPDRSEVRRIGTGV
jgi:2-amino-4-hydroxy-6-hydroxymethyldihydropteridine diphosphokinase